MNAVNQIVESLNTIFAPMDAKVLEETKVWANERMAAIRIFKATDEARINARKDQHAYYSKLFALAGGKTWYHIFDGRNVSMVEAIVVKSCEATAAKRNAAIAAKLIKAGVTEVLSQTYTHSKDGFDGVFVVNTNAGEKKVTINTIYAGGYNIQCLHLRVLTKVK